MVIMRIFKYKSVGQTKHFLFSSHSTQLNKYNLFYMVHENVALKKLIIHKRRLLKFTIVEKTGNPVWTMSINCRTKMYSGIITSVKYVQIK